MTAPDGAAGLPWRRSAQAPHLRKAGLVLLTEDRTSARFVGLSVHQPYRAEATACCCTERCPVDRVHEAPHAAGTCGFHGTSDDPLGWIIPESAILEVELYGRVIRHERGWRASRQRVLGARFVRGCMSCCAYDPQARLVTVPAPVVERALLVGPRCRRCAAVWRWPSMGEGIGLADLAGLLGTEVSWADEATSREVCRRTAGRRPPTRAAG